MPLLPSPARKVVSPLVVALGLLGLPVRGQAPPEIVERSDQDLLVLELRLKHRILNEALPAYLGSGGLLLPLGEVMAALELAVTVDPGSATAEGWFLRENRRFFLDLARRQVMVEGRPAEFVAELAELHPDEIYVDIKLLESWFPIDLEARLGRSQILVHPREKLPVEKKAERHRRWSRSRGGARTIEAIYPRQPLPYRWLDWPAVDHTLALGWREDAGASRKIVRSSLLAAGDLLRMSGELALTLSRDEEVSARLRLGRKDPEAGLLGPLRATSFEVGDLFTPGRPLVSREGEARGFEISSFPLDRPQEFDRRTLRGEALPGWEVELFHNDALIDFLTVGEEGRYELREVPLYFGLNVLRLVFHGPQGERREKVERVLIGPGLVRSGESHYRFAVHEHGRRLFPESGEEETPLQFLPNGEMGREAPHGKPRFFFELERGLRRDLSLSWNVHSLPLEDGRRHTYTGLGLLASRRGVLFDARWTADVAGGWAGRLAARGHLPRVDLSFDHARFFDFRSEETTTSHPLTSRSTLELRSRLRLAQSLATTLTATAEQERYTAPSPTAGPASGRAAGSSASAVALNLAVRRGRFSLAKTLEWRRDLRKDFQPRTLHGGWIVAGRIRSLRLRGSFGYAVSPRAELRDVQLTAQWELKQRLHARLRLVRSFADELSDSIEASLAWRFPSFALGLNARYDDRGRLYSGVTLSHSFGREPHSGSWRMHSRSLATQGATAARVFLDHDLDGRFSPGDEPLEGVRLTTSGARGEPTNREGIVLMSGLPPHRHTDLGLPLRSLDDPFWIPAREGVGLVARPGRLARVELPVTLSAEVDGTVYLRREKGRTEASGVELQLLDPQGEVRYRATSAFDGFYVFDRLVPGRYTLRIAPEQRTRLGLKAAPEREIHLGGGEIRSGVDLLLEIDRPGPDPGR